MSLLLVHPAFPSASAAIGSFSSLLPDQSLDSFGQDLNTTSPVGIPHQPTIHVIDNCTEMSDVEGAVGEANMSRRWCGGWGCLHLLATVHTAFQSLP